MIHLKQSSKYKPVYLKILMLYIKRTDVTEETDTMCIVLQLFHSGTFILVVAVIVSVVVFDAFTTMPEVHIDVVASKFAFVSVIIVSSVALLMVASTVFIVLAVAFFIV